jgi:hypothetical protein
MGIIQTEIRVKGKAVNVPSVQIAGRTVIRTGSWLKTAVLRDEELIEGEAIPELESFLAELRQANLKADLFTFSQKPSDAAPKHPYVMEWDNLAVIPITTFSDWWERRVESSVRRAVRKSAKAGVTVKIAEFNEELVAGIAGINNETPIRQGRRFWHYQKAVAEVKMENSTYVDRTVFLGAYYQNELIAFMRVTFADKVANIVQLLSMMKHYDKRPANALIAKAVEVCEERKMSQLVYYNYIYNDPKSSLTEFKRRNGFQKLLVPRYYVPLTAKGAVAIKAGLQCGMVKRIPQPVVSHLLRLRNAWFERKLKAVEGTL